MCAFLFLVFYSILFYCIYMILYKMEIRKAIKYKIANAKIQTMCDGLTPIHQ